MPKTKPGPSPVFEGRDLSTLYLKEWRIAAGWTMPEVAAITGMAGPQQVYKAETTRGLGLRYAVRLADALGIEVGQLFEKPHQYFIIPGARDRQLEAEISAFAKDFVKRATHV